MSSSLADAELSRNSTVSAATALPTLDVRSTRDQRDRSPATTIRRRLLLLHRRQRRHPPPPLLLLLGAVKVLAVAEDKAGAIVTKW